MRERLRVRDVIYRNKLMSLSSSAVLTISGDAAEAVDCYLMACCSGEDLFPGALRRTSERWTQNAMGCSANCQRNAPLKIFMVSRTKAMWPTNSVRKLLDAGDMIT